MHDFADRKFGYTDESRIKIITEFLSTRNASKQVIDEVRYITNNISFKNGTNNAKLRSIEAMIV